MELSEILKSVSGLIVGFPGAGKTSALPCLLNAGFKMRVLCFDKRSNMAPWAAYSDPAALERLDIVVLDDRLRQGRECMEPAGKPTAFLTGHSLLDHWKHDDVDLGKPSEWGPDTILVLDTITSLGEAAMRWVLHRENRTIKTRRDSDYYQAMLEQQAFLSRVTYSGNSCHTLVLAHKRLMGPPAVRKGDENLAGVVEKKEAMANLVETRWYPSLLGQDPPKMAGRDFGFIALVDVEKIGRDRVRRRITAAARPDIDTKMPGDIPDSLPVDNGLLTVFEALGHKPPKVR